MDNKLQGKTTYTATHDYKGTVTFSTPFKTIYSVDITPIVVMV